MPDKQLFPFWNYSLKPVRIFTKALTMHDIIEYAKSENFKYLVIEASHGDYYGFNIKVEKERAVAMKIGSPDEHDDFMVVGWKVVKKLPKWVHNTNSWIDFLTERNQMRMRWWKPMKLTKGQEKTKRKKRKTKKTETK